jgi:hypothetical protein
VKCVSRSLKPWAYFAAIQMKKRVCSCSRAINNLFSYVSELDIKEKIVRVLWHYIGKVVLLLLFLYLFICSLDLLSSAFKLLGGK